MFRFPLLIPTVVALVTLAGLRPAQGHVLTVDDGPYDYGAAWGFDLASDGTIDTLAVLPLPDHVSDRDAYGSALAALGDLDGNGTPDLAVGAPGDDRAGVGRGAVWILFRKANGSLASRHALRPGRNVFSPPEDARSFGQALASLGDLDGDGTLELAVSGQPAWPSGGIVWILSLRPDGSIARELEISAGHGGFTGTLDSGDGFGGALASLGDVDGNGVADLAVGAPGDDGGAIGAGALWILFLQADGTVASTQKIGNAAGQFGSGLLQLDAFGSALAALGDLNGNGVTELAVGAPGTDSGPQQATGAVWVLRLGSDGKVDSKSKVGDSSGGFVSPLDPSDRFGTSMAALGDVNGNGIPDMVVGAAGDDEAGTDAGAIWVLALNADGTVQSELRLASAFTGLAAGDALGAGLASLGDWDGDGKPDVAAGAIRREGPPTNPDYTSLPTAISAAASGDTILVHGGNYFGVFVVAKSLRIEAANPLNVNLTGGVEVRALSASQSVHVRGLSADGMTFFNNVGRVWVEDCIAQSGSPSDPGMSVNLCSAVIVIRTEVAGTSESTPSALEPGLRMSGSSTVYAYDSRFIGAGQAFCLDDCVDGQVGGAGIRSTGSNAFLFLSGCSVQGGHSLEGGGTGLETVAPAKVLDSVLLGGDCGGLSSCMGAPFSGPVEFLSGASLSMAVDNPTRSGEPTLFTLEGPPGALAFVFFSLTAGTVYRPLRQGVDLLGSQRFVDVFGQIGSDGHLVVSRALGPVPPGFAVELFAQSAYLRKTGPNSWGKVSLQLQLGAASAVTRLGSL